jgi:hypothetical protein
MIGSHCVIQYLNQVSVETDWIRMEDVGVYDNAHFGYMELNNKAYFKVVEAWISKQAMCWVGINIMLGRHSDGLKT